MALFSLASILLLQACSTVPEFGMAPPTGAKIEQSGYATIVRAPPAPYEPPPRILAGWEAPLPPGEVRLPSDDVEILQYRWERGISLSRARAEIMQLRADGPEARAVEARAKAAEPDNFIQLGVQRSPAATWKFAFKRDPERSLRRYTSNPRFVAQRLGYTNAEAEALWETWWPVFEPAATGGSRGAEGVSFMMKLTESEFQALPQFRDFRPPPGVTLEFPRAPDLPRVSADTAPLVRIFPQQRYFPGIITTGGRTYGSDARITLRDGCLFFGKALVRLNRTMGLFRDAQGYLAIRERARTSEPYLRVGEQIAEGGGYSEEISEADRAAITSHCGDHPIVDVYSPRSRVNWEKYRRSQYSVADRDSKPNHSHMAPHSASPSRTTSEGAIVALRTHPDGTPSLTIAPRATWLSSWEAGEDTRRQYFRGDGVSMTVETWAYEPTYACRDESCGLSSIVVDGAKAKLLRLSDPRSVHAFIPRRDDATGRGISVWADCSTAESCRLAEQAIASIRGF